MGIKANFGHFERRKKILKQLVGKVKAEIFSKGIGLVDIFHDLQYELNLMGVDFLLIGDFFQVLRQQRVVRFFPYFRKLNITRLVDKLRHQGSLIWRELDLLLLLDSSALA